MAPKFHLVKALTMQDGGASISLEYLESVDTQLATARVVLFDRVVYEGGPATALIKFNRLLKSYLSGKRANSDTFSSDRLKLSDILNARYHRREEVASG